MNDDKLIAIFIFLTALFTFIATIFFADSMFRKEAIQAGVATYVTNTKTGKPVFTWIKCETKK